MHLSALLALPPALLAALVASEAQWPHNLPSHEKYFPEDEAHVKRNLDIYERLKRERPVGMRKMSEDPREMFLLDNWIFAEPRSEGAGRRSQPNVAENRREVGNGTFYAMSPLRPHMGGNLFNPFSRVAPRAALWRRDFKCPDGTGACTSIGAPNSCCSTSDLCINVPDTGFGNVGCCPKGQQCAGPISCETSKGYTSCPGSENGGCCLPGYSCSGVGCVIAGTSVTYVQPSTSTIPSSTAVVIVPTTPSTSAPPSSTQSCTSGFFSCPQSLDGGCCRNGQTCGQNRSCINPPSTTSQVPSAPIRPTSVPPVSSDSPSNSICPQGFYVCSAYYPSGCCRVGSDCQTTGSCLPTASVTVVNTNGVIILAPTGASLATTAPGQGGSCPSAWYSCAANVGGNCCPNGFACGEACTATGSVAPSQSIVGKVAPSTAGTVSMASIWGMALGALAIGMSMILL